MSNVSIHLPIVECNFLLFSQNLKFLNTFLVFLIITIRFDLPRSGDSYITTKRIIWWHFISKNFGNRQDKILPLEVSLWTMSWVSSDFWQYRKGDGKVFIMKVEYRSAATLVLITQRFVCEDFRLLFRNLLFIERVTFILPSSIIISNGCHARRNLEEIDGEIYERHMIMSEEILLIPKESSLPMIRGLP